MCAYGERQRRRIVATVFGGFTVVCALKREGEQIMTIGFGGLTVIIVLSEGGEKCARYV